MSRRARQRGDASWGGERIEARKENEGKRPTLWLKSKARDRLSKGREQGCFARKGQLDFLKEIC